MGERMEVEFSRTCAFCDGGPTQPPCVECSGAGFLAVVALAPEGSLTAALLRLGLAAEAWNRRGNTDSEDLASWSAMREASFALAALRNARNTEVHG